MIMFSVFITDVLMLHFKDHEVRETFSKINLIHFVIYAVNSILLLK